MCHFVTATLPSREISPVARDIVETHGLLYEAIENPTVRVQLGDEVGYFRATGGMCDCGTALGSGARSQAGIDQQKELRKLRKKGWSETKIARWLESKERNEKKVARARTHQMESPDLESWCVFLIDLVENGSCEPAGILLHMYSGGIENERIHLAGREDVPLSKLTPAFLLDIEEDVLYSFRSSAA